MRKSKAPQQESDKTAITAEKKNRETAKNKHLGRLKKEKLLERKRLKGRQSQPQ